MTLTPKNIPIPIPLKGVNRNFARGTQPPGTCYDSLNMLPFDRQNRLRVAQRSGLTARDTLTEGFKVKLLHAASIAKPASEGSNGYVDGTPTPGDSSFIIDLSELGAGSENLEDATGNWDVGTSGFDGGGIQPYFDRFDGARSGTFSGELMYLTADCEFLQIVGAAENIGHAAAFSTVDMTPADNFRVVLPITIDATEQDQIVFLSVRMDADNPQTTTGIITVAFSITGGVFEEYSCSILLDDTVIEEDTELQGNFPTHIGIQVEGSTVKVFSGTEIEDGDTNVLVTATIPGQNTSHRGVAFGMTWGGNPGTSVNVSPGVWTRSGSITAASLNRTDLKLVAATGTDVWVGESPSSMVEATDTATFPLDATAVNVAAATLFGFTYIVDGNGDPKKLNVDTKTMVAFTESAGTVPQDATIAVAYRGRLVLAGFDNDPQNFVASRSGNPLDWDTSQDDPAAAWAGNAAETGRVGEPIIGLLAASEDRLIIFCEQSVWMMKGDIAYGGAIMPISQVVGIAGPNAWCRDGDGNIYFVSSSGLNRMSPDGSNLQDLSRDSYPQFFQALDRASNHISLMYDPDRLGIWIMVTPSIQDEAPVVSMFFHIPLQGFWPVRFTNLPDAGPVSVIFWDGFATDTRYPVFGGYEGVLYSLSEVGKRDEGQAIDCYIVLGPLQLSQTDDAILNRLDVTAGEVMAGDSPEADFTMDWSVRGGKTAYSVTEGSPLHTAAGTFSTDGRQITRVTRVRGGVFSVRFANSTSGDYCSLESVSVGIKPSGRQR